MELRPGQEQSSTARIGVANPPRVTHLAGPDEPTKILILGGGFGGVSTAKKLEKLFPNKSNVQITLVARDNFFLMAPLLFEAMSGFGT